MKAVTFIGTTWRCKLAVYDYTDGAVKAWKNKPITFSVQALTTSAHKATPFSTGYQLYYGTSLANALAVIETRTRKDPSLPKAWSKYMGRA